MIQRGYHVFKRKKYRISLSKIQWLLKLFLNPSGVQENSTKSEKIIFNNPKSLKDIIHQFSSCPKSFCSWLRIYYLTMMMLAHPPLGQFFFINFKK